jgi:hypothetical protein
MRIDPRFLKDEDGKLRIGVERVGGNIEGIVTIQLKNLERDNSWFG